jgi:hypothetical protein
MVASLSFDSEQHFSPPSFRRWPESSQLKDSPQRGDNTQGIFDKNAGFRPAPE